MPEIPQFIASQPEPFERDTATANPGAYAAAGNATQGLGRSIEGLGDAVGKLVEYHNTVAYNEALANAVAVGADNFESGKDEVRKTGNYQGFTQRQLAAFDQHTQQALQDAPTGAVSARLERRFAIERKNIQTRASGFEHQFGAESELANINSDVDETGTRLYRNPSLFQDQIERISHRIAETGDAGLLNPQQQQILAKKAGNTLATAHLLGRAETDPTGTMADLKAGKYDAYLDPHTLEAIQPKLQANIAKGISARLVPSLTPGGGADTGAGDTWELRNNNFGGLRKPGVNAGPNAGGFQSFDTPEAGVQAIESQLERYYQGKTTGKPLTTLRQIVSTWAPPNENDTPTLIARAAKVTGFDPDQPLTFDAPTRAKLIEATIRNEQGGKLPVDPAIIAKVAGAAPPTTAADHGRQGGLADIYNRVDRMGLDPEIATKVKANLRVNYDALEADQARQQRQVAQQEKQQSDTAENQIIADSRSDQPKITARDVANNEALTPAAKLRMIQFLAKDGVVDPGLSHQTAIDLMKGIANGTVIDRAPLIEAFGQSKLGWQDFDHLDKQLADARTPDGERLQKRKAEFLKGIEPQIDKSAFAGVPDITGKERFYDFQVQLDQKIDEYRKANKNPADLLDPSKPDYFGKPEALKPYKRDLNQLLSDLPGGGTPAAAAPDLSSKDGIVAAYKARKISRDAATRALVAGGFADAPAAAPAAAPEVPVR